jgi:monoamine oxidase
LLNQTAVQVYVNQKVFKVVWSEEGNEIVCGNGITVYAKNVVIAVPIGVLKNQGIQFVPPLPGWKN